MRNSFQKLGCVRYLVVGSGKTTKDIVNNSLLRWLSWLSNSRNKIMASTHTFVAQGWGLPSGKLLPISRLGTSANRRFLNHLTAAPKRRGVVSFSIASRASFPAGIAWSSSSLSLGVYRSIASSSSSLSLGVFRSSGNGMSCLFGFSESYEDLG